jgi:hypothetical protein
MIDLKWDKYRESLGTDLKSTTKVLSIRSFVLGGPFTAAGHRSSAARQDSISLPDMRLLAGACLAGFVNQYLDDIRGAAKRPVSVDVAEAFRNKDSKIREVEALMTALPYGATSPFAPTE